MHKTIRRGLLLLGLIVLSTAVHGIEPDKQFTAFETEHVRVKTPGLFAKSNQFLIEFHRLGNDDWCFPLQNAKVISEYASIGSRKNHTGIDLKTKPNDTIRAAFRGIVRLSKPYGAYGNVIVIRHLNGLETVYSHNSKNLVKPGDVVRAGDPIGLVGRTGRATTEHLHFEIRINGEHLNPHIVFNMSERTLRKRCLEATKRGTSVAIKAVEPTIDPARSTLSAQNLK